MLCNHILHTNKTKQEDIKLLSLARFKYIVAVMFLICRMEIVAWRIHDMAEGFSRSIRVCLLDAKALSE